MCDYKYVDTLVSKEIWEINATLATIIALNKSKVFDELFYSKTYQDDTFAGLTYIEHYVLHGSHEGKKPVWWFDTSLYLKKYPDVAQDGINPFWHYLRYGRSEKRKLYFATVQESIKFSDEAMQKREFTEALQRWSATREQFPTTHHGYTRAVTACLDLTNFVQAEALAREAMEKVPGAIESFICYADVSMRQRDFEEALKRWAVVREKFPKYTTGYTRAADACIEMADWTQAKALRKQAMELEPGNTWFACLYGETSMRQRDFKDALHHWAWMREKFPATHHGYTRAATTCQELGDFVQAEVFAKAAMEKVSGAIESFICYADVSMRQRDFEEALKRWAVVREKFPRHTAGYTRAADACIEMADWTQAKALRKQAMELEPGNAWLACLYGEISMRQRDFKDALHHWAWMREEFPATHHGYTRAATVCLELGDFVQAEVFAKEAMEKVSGAIESFICYADVSMRQRDFEEALKRWVIVREKFPRHTAGYTRAADACIEMADWMQAKALRKQAMELEPGNAWLACLYGDIHMQQRDFEEALHHWAWMRERFPATHHGYTRAATACLELGNLVQADAFAKEAMEKVPGAIESFICYADVSMHQRDFSEALNRWAVVRGKFPEHAAGYTRAADACIEMADWSQAKVLRKQAMELEPKNMNFITLYSHISIHQQKFERFLNQVESITNSKDIDLGWVECATLRKIDCFDYQQRTNPVQVYIFLLCCNLTESFRVDIKKYNIFNYLDIDTFCFLFGKNQVNLGNMFEKWIFEELFDEDVLTGYRIYIYSCMLMSISINSYRRFTHNILFKYNTRFYSDKYFQYTKIAALNDAKNEKKKKFIPSVINNKKLSVAICISGQLRGYKEAFTSIDNIVDRNKYNVTIYVHTWNDIGRKFSIGEQSYRLFSGIFLLAYMSEIKNETDLKISYPSFYKLVTDTSLTTEDDVKLFYNTEYVVVEDSTLDDFKKMSNPEKMYYKNYSCYKIIKNPQYFDIIFRLRPDIFYIGNQYINLNRISQYKNKIFSDIRLSCLKWGVFGMGDVLAAGSPDVMDKYMNTWYDAKNFFWKNNIIGYSPAFRGHETAASSLYYYGIETESLSTKTRFCDPEKIYIEKIYEAICKDVSTRSPTHSDEVLLSACLKDMNKN